MARFGILPPEQFETLSRDTSKIFTLLTLPVMDALLPPEVGTELLDCGTLRLAKTS
jgi:hypothetical protein